MRATTAFIVVLVSVCGAEVVVLVIVWFAAEGIRLLVGGVMVIVRLTFVRCKVRPHDKLTL